MAEPYYTPRSQQSHSPLTAGSTLNSTYGWCTSMAYECLQGQADALNCCPLPDAGIPHIIQLMKPFMRTDSYLKGSVVNVLVVSGWSPKKTETTPFMDHCCVRYTRRGWHLWTNHTPVCKQKKTYTNKQYHCMTSAHTILSSSLIDEAEYTACPHVHVGTTQCGHI